MRVTETLGAHRIGSYGEPRCCISCGRSMGRPRVWRTALPGWARMVNERDRSVVLVCPGCKNRP